LDIPTTKCCRSGLVRQPRLKGAAPAGLDGRLEWPSHACPCRVLRASVRHAQRDRSRERRAVATGARRAPRPSGLSVLLLHRGEHTQRYGRLPQRLYLASGVASTWQLQAGRLVEEPQPCGEGGRADAHRRSAGRAPRRRGRRLRISGGWALVPAQPCSPLSDLGYSGSQWGPTPVGKVIGSPNEWISS
jgi:hypothetical protein